MSNDLLNILSHSNKDIDNQKLMNYLSGHLSQQEKAEVEQWMEESVFLREAMQGLEQVSDKSRLDAYVDQLNQELHNRLGENKEKRERKKIREYPFIYLALILILLLGVISYVVVRMYLK